MLKRSSIVTEPTSCSDIPMRLSCGRSVCGGRSRVTSCSSANAGRVGIEVFGPK